MAVRNLEARIAAKIAIPKLLNLLPGPTAIVRALVNMGASYNRQEMFRDVNESIAWQRTGPLLQQTDKSWGVPHDLFVPSYHMRQDRRYRFVGLATYEDERGELTTRRVSFFSNYNAPEYLLNDELEQYSDQRGFDYGVRLRSFELEHALWNPTMGHSDLLELEEL